MMRLLWGYDERLAGMGFYGVHLAHPFYCRFFKIATLTKFARECI